MRPRIVPAADLAAKVGLVVLLVVAVVWPDLGGLKGKAGGTRLAVYPLGAAVVPLLWWSRWRPQRRAYPWLGDLLFTLPWFLDTLGNRLDLFDTLWWFDDFMHFASWALLTSAILVLFPPRHGLSAFVERGLAFGVPAAVVWELGEYVAFIRHSAELQTAYTDTLGDLGLGSLGSLIAALVVWRVRLVRPDARVSRQPPSSGSRG